jgi:hypothetical protein
MAVVLLAQFIHQVLKFRRERQFRPHALLQPFSHGIADGLAGPVIDWLRIATDSVFHDLISLRVPKPIIWMKSIGQVSQQRFVSLHECLLAFT